MPAPTALIAEDEPLLRKGLARALEETWPELRIVALAKNGRQAVDQFEALHPDVCFLDIHMPEMSGIEAAGFIAERAHVVFVTAYDEYAIQAFENGAIDYLVKPVQLERLSTTVRRLKARLLAQEIPRLAELLAPLRARVAHSSPPGLKWLHVSSGKTLRLVNVEEIDYARSEGKYTLVAWRDDRDRPFEGLVRFTVRELLAQLDAETFVQVHRSVLVNLHAIERVSRSRTDAYSVHIRRRADILPVSRQYQHLFKQM